MGGTPSIAPQGAPRPQGRAGHIAACAGRTRLTARMEGGTPSPRGPPPSHRERSRQASRRSRRLRTAMRHVSATRTVAFSATLPAPAQAVLSPCRHSASLRRPKSDRLSGKFKVRHCPPRQQFSTEAAILILAFSSLNWTGLPVDLARIGFETRSAMRLTAKPDAKMRIAGHSKASLIRHPFSVSLRAPAGEGVASLFRGNRG